MKFDFESGLQFAQANGITGMEVAAGGQAAKEYCDLDYLLADEDHLKRWLDIYHKYDLNVVSLSCHGAPLSPDPKIQTEYKRQFRQACDLMERIGINRMTLVAGLPEGAEGETIPVWITQQTQEPNLDFWLDTMKWQWDKRLIPFWKEHGKIASDHGVTLCFEMQVADMLNTPTRLKQFRDEIGPVVACNFDISHMWAQGIDPSTALRYLGPLVQHVHLKDTYVDDYNTRLNGFNNPISAREPEKRSWNFTQAGYGHDEGDWRDVLTTLRFIGYDDILSIEMECEYMDVEEAIIKTVEFIKPLMFTKPVQTKWWEHANWRMAKYQNKDA
jgi:sugar phosphate isomerase/epimerase